MRLAYGCFEHPDRNAPKLHMHRHCELLYFYRVKGKFHVEGNEYTVNDGDLIAIRPREMHYMELAPNSAYDRLVLRFDPELFASMDPEYSFLRLFFQRPAGKPNLYHTIKNSRNNWTDAIWQIHNQPTRNHILANLLTLLVKLDKAFSSDPMDTVRETQEYRIMRYIDENPQADLSIDALCKKFYISRTQLYHRFLKATNISIGKYIAMQRMLYAQQLLEQGYKPTAIFHQCGFRDYSTFYRAYMRYWKRCPGDEVQKTTKNQDLIL